MWYRLKSSLLSALIATLLVLGVKGLAQPVETESIATAPLQLVEPTDRAVVALAVRLAALAIDAAVEGRHAASQQVEAAAREAVKATEANARRRALRMPFYSFATRAPRTRES
jgi:hypothetical protein